MSDYHFFYVDVDGITIRPPYPLRSESERRILGIDDFCWAYEAACTVTCQPRPAANRKVRFAGRELGMYYWRESVNMVKDCLTKQKYNALVGATWFAEPLMVERLYNYDGGDIDTPWPGKTGSDVFRVFLAENDVFCCANELPDGISDLISQLDSRSLFGIEVFWNCVSTLNVFFEHDGICKYDNNQAAQYTVGPRYVKQTYDSGESDTMEADGSAGLVYYSKAFDNRPVIGSRTPRIEEYFENGEFKMTITNQCFLRYIERVCCTRQVLVSHQHWGVDQGGVGLMMREWRVNDIVSTLTLSDGRATQEGMVFELPAPIGQATECRDLMMSLGYGENLDYSQVYWFLTFNPYFFFTLKFPWTAED